MTRKATAPPPTSPLVRYRAVLLGLAALAGVLVIGFVLLQSASGKSYVCESLLTPPPSASSDPAELGFATENLGNQHVPPGSTITFGYCPPASGSHYSSGDRGPIRSAVYGPGSEQPPGGWVHNLEHGAVVVLYRCPSGSLGVGDCTSVAEMALMQSWFASAPAVNNCPKQAVVARFDSMATPFAVLAWDRALLLEEFDLAQATAFAQQWTDVTAPEPTVCSSP